MPRVKSSLYLSKVFFSHNRNMALEIQEEFLDNFLSNHTRISYRTDIHQFFYFLEKLSSKKLDFSEVKRYDIIQFRNHMQRDKEYTPKTVGRKLAAISSYFDFLVEKGLSESNPSLSVKRPRKEVVRPTPALLKEQVSGLVFPPLVTEEAALFTGHCW